MSVLESQPTEELLGLQSDKLRGMFALNKADMEGDHDRFNRLSHEAQTGWNGAAHTSAGQEKKRKETELQSKGSSNVRAMAQTTIDAEFNVKLSGITLDDEEHVNINKQGVLMVRGEGAESEFREATLDEKLQLETESMACSVAITQDEIDMNAYFRGETDIIPEALQAMAEERGLSDPSRDDLKTIFKEEYADSLHITDRVLSDHPLTSGALALDDGNLLAPTPREGTSAAPAGFESPELNRMFGFAADPEPNMSTIPETPQYTPIPTPELAPS